MCVCVHDVPYYIHVEGVFEAVNHERDKIEAKEQAKHSKSGKGTHIVVYLHTYIHTYVRTYIHMYILAYMHIMYM